MEPAWEKVQGLKFQLSSYKKQKYDRYQSLVNFYYDLVNIIREHEGVFPAWHCSSVAELYKPKVFENQKKSGGYWF